MFNSYKVQESPINYSDEWKEFEEALTKGDGDKIRYLVDHANEELVKNLARIWVRDVDSNASDDID